MSWTDAPLVPVVPLTPDLLGGHAMIGRRRRFTREMVAYDVAMDGNVALTHLVQPAANLAMKGRQPMEGDGRTQVVFGVIGHIPKEKIQ